MRDCFTKTSLKWNCSHDEVLLEKISKHYARWNFDGEWKNIRSSKNFVEADFVMAGFDCRWRCQGSPQKPRRARVGHRCIGLPEGTLHIRRIKWQSDRKSVKKWGRSRIVHDAELVLHPSRNDQRLFKINVPCPTLTCSLLLENQFTNIRLQR